jgi:pimeloyl-ACP methyl ester carboxylesterase
MSRSQLLFLPAAGRVAADFEPIRDELGRDRRSRALDWPAGEHGVASLARWVIEETRDWREPMVVVGHSVGGAAGIELAIARPELVRGLILVDSAGFLELGFFERLFCRVKGIAAVTRTIEPRFARWHTRVHNRDTDAMIARVEANRGRPGWAEGVASIWRSFTRPEADLLVRARQLAIPTLIVWGEHDPVIPMRAARAAERAIPGARLVTFPTGHTPFLEAREGFLAAAGAFLAELPAARDAA